MKYGGRTGWKEGERRSHSSRSIGVPEVIGNDKVGKMREEPREGGKSGTEERRCGHPKYGTRAGGQKMNSQRRETLQYFGR